MIMKLELGSIVFFFAYALVSSSPEYSTMAGLEVHNSKWSSKTVEIIAILACVVIAIIIIFFVVCMKRRKRQQHSIKNRDSEMALSSRDSSSNKKDSVEASHHNTIKDRIFRNKLIENYSYEDLQKSTNDFSVHNLIEGSVYQGRLNGKVFAIKRVSSDHMSRINFSLFDKKNLHHPNIVSLYGACVMDGSDSFLVLEYAKNGSLKDWIFRGLAMKSQFIHSSSCFLSWEQRLRICLDVAVALKHMHFTMEPSYVHGNIRCRNIFLDEEFNAKVGIFGIQQHDANEGYLTPECTISPAIDVFAYGVVLLEVLSGKPGIRQHDDVAGDGIRWHDDVAGDGSSGTREEALVGWVDGALGESYSFEQASALAELGMSCVEVDALSRPNAGEIVDKLTEILL